MDSIRIWVLATRPKTLFASISPVLIGSVLAYTSHNFSWWTCFFTLLTALGIQISTNFVNDYCDFLKGADTSQRKGPTRITQSGLVSLSTMKKAIGCVLMLTACAGLYLICQGGIYIALLLLLSLLLAVLYTAGPYPLAYLGLGDLFVLVFFGPVAVVGTYFLQTHYLSWEGVWIGFALGALSTAILCVNNLRDINEDKQATKKTLTVRFGTSFAKIEYVTCLLIAAATPCILANTHTYTLLSILFLIPAISCIKTVFFYKDPRELNAVLGKTGKLLTLYTTLLSIGWILK